MATWSKVHPENRVERRDPKFRQDPNARSPLRLIFGGMFCGLLAAGLAWILLFVEIRSGDIWVTLAMVPISLVSIAMVTAWVAAMILVGPGTDFKVTS